jgi:predicted Fe-S protein YdhL (DUF1289 family)
LKDFLISINFKQVTPNQVIYEIHQSSQTAKIWRELNDEQKRQVLKECESRENVDIELIIGEVVDGQRRLF